MSAFEMKIFNLQSGEEGVAQFPSVAAAKAWLAERPKFLEVRGPVAELGPGVEAELRHAMRPLDKEELAQRDLNDIERELERRADLESMNEAAWGGNVPASGAAAVQVVVWTRGGAYKDGERPGASVSAPVREAARVWLVERDGWVRSHGHHVSAATLRVTRHGEVEADSQFATREGTPSEPIE